MELPTTKPLPAWEEIVDRRMLGIEEGEEWKYKEHLDASEKLYNKWLEIFELVHTYTEAIVSENEDENSSEEWTQRLIFENLMAVTPKLVSATCGGLYILQMENAAVIRFNCIKMMEQVKFAVLDNQADEEHAALIVYEMDEFKILFKAWVQTFITDEYEDEWGVF